MFLMWLFWANPEAFVPLLISPRNTPSVPQRFCQVGFVPVPGLPLVVSEGSRMFLVRETCGNYLDVLWPVVMLLVPCGRKAWLLGQDQKNISSGSY